MDDYPDSPTSDALYELLSLHMAADAAGKCGSSISCSLFPFRALLCHMAAHLFNALLSTTDQLVLYLFLMCEGEGGGCVMVYIWSHAPSNKIE